MITSENIYEVVSSTGNLSKILNPTIDPLANINKYLSPIMGMNEMFLKAETMKCDTYLVHLNYIYGLDYDGYIMTKMELESGYSEKMFSFSLNETKTPTALQFRDYVTNHNSEYYYIYKDSYIITEADSNLEDIIINGEFIVNASDGKPVDHMKINRTDIFNPNYLRNVAIVEKYNNVEIEFATRSNEVFTLENYEKNPKFIQMITGKVSDGHMKFIEANPATGKLYFFILHKGIVPIKKNDKIRINILDAKKFSIQDPDIFYMKLEVLRNKKTPIYLYITFINVV